MTSTIESQQKIGSIPSTIFILILLIGVLALSLAAILIKASEQYIGPNATVFNRFWIATVMLAVWRGIQLIPFQGRDFQKQTKPYTCVDILLLLLSGILTSANLLLWAWSITQTSVANANLLHNLTPIFATFGGWLLLNHRFDQRFLIGLLLTMGGAIAIGIQDFQISADQLIGDVLALLSAVFYAANLLIVEKLRDSFAAISILLWSCFFRVFITFPIALLTEEQLFPSSLAGWIPVFCLALFCQVIGSGILNYSLKHFASGFVALFLLLEPIVAAMLAWFIFAERLSLLNCLAFIVVLFGIYIAQSGKGGEKAEQEIMVEDMVSAE